MERTNSQLEKQLKIVIIGDAAVGKTCLLTQYLEKKFIKKYQKNNTADSKTGIVTVGHRNFNVQFWDTAGKEYRVDTIGPVYYKTADCAVFVFDMTNRESLQYIEEKYGEFLLYRNLSRDNPSFPIVLIGNKEDEKAKRSVPKEEVNEWLNQNDDPLYYEVSAKDEAVVKQVFDIIVKYANGTPKETLEAIPVLKQDSVCSLI